MTERVRQRGMVWLPVLVCFAGVMMASAFWLHEYRQAAFQHISTFCEVIIRNNPDIETQVLSAVKEYHTSEGADIGGNNILAQYGYRSSGFCTGPGWQYIALSSIVFFVTAGAFLVSTKYMDRRSRLRIAELTNYLEQINRGANGTIIQRSEDEFSHLQDEMYKTVTELYQTRESAVKARMNFAENLANIAHQLKTPITAALLSLQLMETAPWKSHPEQIKRQLERLESLEEALLTLSRIDAGTLLMESSKVDVYTALSLAAENLSDLLAKENISVSIPDNGCVEITGDLEWTMEALMNLMKNCMEHSPRGGTIHCGYSYNPLYVEILIWDEGEGFWPEDIPRLFERFYRGKRAAGDGIGIGLSLARSIIELQNGNINVCNLPKGGACFEIRIYSH